MLNGAEFTVVGCVLSRIYWASLTERGHSANSYWVGLSGYSTADMDKAFSDIAATGATTVRTWGFNEIDATPYGGEIYYQSWSNGVPTVNTGATGLQNFDNVIAQAKANGLRLIVALTNNWSDYG
jgi:mannan endo-1,4-beta-mannosidase